MRQATVLEEDRVPRFVTSELPVAEQDDARMIQFKVYELSQHVSRFESALALFDFSYARIAEAEAARDAARAAAGEIQRRAIQDAFRSALKHPLMWIQIAGRDATITRWDFGASLEAIHTRLHRCPTLLSFVDRAELHLLKMSFYDHFPDAKKARHGGAHLADISNTPQRNVCSEPPPDIAGVNFQNVTNYSINGVFGRDYVVTIEKKILKCSVSKETHDTLVGMQVKLYALLRNAERETTGLLRKRMKEKEGAV